VGWRFTILVAALGAAALGGCGGGQERPPVRTVDVVAVQDELTRRMARVTGTMVDAMACPQVIVRTGRTFECSASFDGEPGVIVVTLTDSTGRHYRARLKNLLLGRLEAALQSGLARTGFRAASVDCPGPVPQQRGQVSFCTVEDRRGRQARVRVVQIDAEGRVRFRQVPLSRRRPG
jgi:Domain of unknown function (DUF4333)